MHAPDDVLVAERPPRQRGPVRGAALLLAGGAVALLAWTTHRSGTPPYPTPGPGPDATAIATSSPVGALLVLTDYNAWADNRRPQAAVAFTISNATGAPLRVTAITMTRPPSLRAAGATAMPPVDAVPWLGSGQPLPPLPPGGMPLSAGGRLAIVVSVEPACAPGDDPDDAALEVHYRVAGEPARQRLSDLPSIDGAPWLGALVARACSR